MAELKRQLAVKPEEPPLAVPLAFPSIEQRDIENVVAVLQSGQLVQGRYVSALERAIELYVGVDHAVAVSSGTATLHLALMSQGIGPEDEVIVPAFSFVATANVVELVGAKPIFVDIRLQDFNIDPSKIERAITPRTRAIMPVHEFGHPADMDAIMSLANRYSICVIEDAACALGSEWKGKKTGSIGKIGSFSLHPRKAITSGEGGVLCTNDAEVAEFFRAMRNHGIRSAGNKMAFVAAGLNYRMTDIHAALVIGQMERLDSIIDRRRQIANRYAQELTPHFFLKPSEPETGETCWQSYHIVLQEGIAQSAFLNYLALHNIGANYGAQCIPVQTYYREKYGYRPEDFPNALRAFSQGIALPLFEAMTDRQLSWVIETVNGFKG